MRNMECFAALEVTGATGFVTKGPETRLEAIPGNHSLHQAQNAAVQGTAHVPVWVGGFPTGSRGEVPCKFLW
jgi:hypothetical protein